MVLEAIKKMKSKKAAEMLKASGDTGAASLVANLANTIIRNGDMPSDWEDSFSIIELKLHDHVMKRIDRITGKIIRVKISIDGMQLGFIPGRGTTDAIFILKQLQEKTFG